MKSGSKFLVERNDFKYFFVLLILSSLAFLSILAVIFTFEKFLTDIKMSVNYEQHCMIGVSFGFDELKLVISKAEYKFEDRYDTKTGKVTHQEKVLVKEEKVCYELCGRMFDYIEDIQLDGLDVEIDHSNQIVYIGLLPASEAEDVGRVSLLYDSLDLSNLENLKNEVKRILPQYANRIGLHLFYTVS